MGVSTNAILAFGFDLGEEWPEGLATPDNDEESGESNWIDFLNSISGLTEPETTNYKDPAWPAHWAAQRAFEKAYPVTVEEHCSGESPMYFLALRGSVTSARRGYPTAIETPIVAAEQWQALKTFCDTYGIPWQEPKWHIFSMWN